MSILRFTASQDTTITNAYKENLATRATDSNMGSADILEVFNIYAQASTSSSEKSRALVQFPLADIISKRSAGTVPASGSVNWYLRLYNAEHSSTLPDKFTMVAAAVSQSWEEGYGLDMDQYSDPGLGNSGYGATWSARATGSVSQGSLLLDGAADYVTVSDHDDFTFSNNSDSDSAFSVSAWVYLDDLGNAHSILTKWNTASSNKREWNLNVQVTTGLVFFLLYDETNDVQHEAKTTTALSATTWYHITVTYDGRSGATAGTGIKIYIDGTSDTLTVTNNSSYVIMRNTAADVIIGAETSASTFFDGKLDEISVWDKKLSATEVTELYNSGCPEDLRFHSAYISTAADLIAWWRFETAAVATADTTTTIQDHSDNSHSGTGTSLVAGSLSTTTPGTCTTTTLYWITAGGQFSTTAGYTYSQYFEKGFENLEVDISHVVEEWIKYENNSSTGIPNYGMGVHLHSDQEGATRGYYTKKFFGRGTEYFFKRPLLEARWDSSKNDDSRNFYLSSSMLDSNDNLNNLYLYNIVKGQLKDIPGLQGSPNVLLVSVFDEVPKSSSYPLALPRTNEIPPGVAAANDLSVTASRIETGVYTASFAYTSSATTIYPVWHTGSSHLVYNNTQFHTGSAIAVKTHYASNYNSKTAYVSNITNLKSAYANNEQSRFRVYVRQKDWNPTIYSIASADIETTVVEGAYYKVVRIVDDYDVINYGTASTNHTLMSYDASGNYFDLDMSMLESGYAYVIKLLYKVNGEYVEQSEEFKFRVE